MKHLLIYLTLFFTTNAFTSQDQIKEELGEANRTTESNVLCIEDRELTNEDYKNLASKTNIEKLTISYCYLDTLKMVKVAQHLKNYTHLIHINFSNNNNPHCSDDLEKLFVNNKSLRTINLESNSLGDNILSYIKALSALPELELLNISGNYISANALIKFLDDIITVRTNLGYPQITVIASTNIFNNENESGNDQEANILTKYKGSSKIKVIFEDFS